MQILCSKRNVRERNPRWVLAVGTPARIALFFNDLFESLSRQERKRKKERQRKFRDRGIRLPSCFEYSTIRIIQPIIHAPSARFYSLSGERGAQSASPTSFVVVHRLYLSPPPDSPVLALFFLSTLHLLALPRFCGERGLSQRDRLFSSELFFVFPRAKPSFLSSLLRFS